MNIGQKVVCIDDNFDDAAKRVMKEFPVKDRIYVIRGVHLGLTPLTTQRQQRQSKIKLLLYGVVNGNAMDGKEHGFNSERFRLLDEMRQAGRNPKISELDDVGVNDGDVRVWLDHKNEQIYYAPNL